jgi:hypothetical protein
MFNLPNLDVDDFELFADWAELCALCSGTPTISQDDVGDVFKDAGLFATEVGDIPDDDFGLADDLTFSSDDELERLTENIWRILRQRQRMGHYPFTVERDTLTRLVPSWEAAPAFTMLLLSDICRKYELVEPVALEADGKSGRLFEKIVEASTASLFNGTSVRFGWTPDDDWPRPSHERVEMLGNRLSLDVEKLDGKVQPHDKDRGLDVVARLEFGNGQLACPYFLIQCAIGKHWKNKRGEPTLEAWENIFQWVGPRLRVVAIPWRLDETWNYKRAYLHFGAVILDRPRLNCGGADRKLKSDVASEIKDWCALQIAKIPLI